MSPAEIIRKWTDALNRQDAAAAAELYAPNATVTDPSYSAPLEGRAAIQEDIEVFIRAFPDVRVTIQPMVVDDSTYAVEGTFVGTHQGTLVTEAGDIPPSGKPFELRAAGFARLDGQGRILEERRYYDLAKLSAQLEPAS